MLRDRRVSLTDIAGFTKYGAKDIHLFVRDAMSPLNVSEKELISLLKGFCPGRRDEQKRAEDSQKDKPANVTDFHIPSFFVR
jgi:hypothetical protein